MNSLILGADFGQGLLNGLRTGFAANVLQPGMMFEVGELGAGRIDPSITFEDGSLVRALLHAGTGALGGLIMGDLRGALGGALGAGLSELVVPAVAASFDLNNASDAPTLRGLSQILGGLGSLVVQDGSFAGAISALNGFDFNRTLHNPEVRRVEPSNHTCNEFGICTYTPAFPGGISVGGITYSDSRYIPGNEPVPVMMPDGSPMLDFDGDPVYRPSRALNLEEIGDRTRNRTGLLDRNSDFGHYGSYDYQRMRRDDGSLLFMRDYTAYSNIAIGYSYAAQGGTWEDAAAAANRYAVMSTFSPSEPMDSVYTRLPVANIVYYQTGYNAYCIQTASCSPVQLRTRP